MSDEDSRRKRRPIGGDPVDTPSGVRPGRMPLEGAYASLEVLDPRRHAAALFDIAQYPGLWTFMSYGPFPDRGTMATWLRTCAATADPAFFAIRDRKSGTLAGMASFLEIRPAMGVAEIGHIWFAPAFQRTTLNTDALFVMMRHVMDELGYRRLEWKCNALNQASRKAALRLGFRFEGVFYNHIVFKGRNRDTAWYSILDTEWPQVRTNHEAWLAPGNFDEAGRQRSSLSALNRALWGV